MADKENDTAEEEQAPQQMKIGPQQIQAAAAAGAELLSDKDLRVPLGAAGQLSILQGVLAAIGQGVLAVVSAEEAALLKASPPNRRPNRSKKPAAGKK